MICENIWRGAGAWAPPCVRPWIKLNQATYLLLRSLLLFCSLLAIGILWLLCPGWVTHWWTMVEYRHAFLKELMSVALVKLKWLRLHV